MTMRMNSVTNVLKNSCLLVLMLCVGCANDETGSPPQGIDYYPIETNPVLSADREYVYLSLSDSLVPALTGIYRARVTRPERERVWLDLGLASPSASADLQRIAALRHDTLVVFTVSDSTVWIPGSGIACQSACFVGNSQLIISIDSVLYRITVPGGSMTFERHGYDPVAYSDSSYLYIAHPSQYQWSVIEHFLNGVADTLYTQTSVVRPLWPMLNGNRDRLLLSVPVESGYDLVVHNLSSNQSLTVAQSRYPRATLAGNNVLFTGDHPLLNQVSIFGGQASLWVYTVPNETSPVSP